MMLSPPLTEPQQLVSALQDRGFAIFGARALCDLARSPIETFDALGRSWGRLPADVYLKDGGRYRFRRHSCFIVEGPAVEPVPHRAHWQPVEYNALHGGLERWFDPIEAEVLGSPAWPRLLRSLADICSTLKGAQRWHLEAHQFRIDTSDGIGRPTPEGAHRDGVDYVAVVLVDRQGIKGGETRVFEAHGPHGIRFTLTEPWSVLLLDDARVIHETTPIQPLKGIGHRDTLVLTFRARGFQGPPSEA